MKYTYILLLTFLLTMIPSYVSSKDLSDKKSLPDKSLNTFKIPITEEATRAINIIMKHKKCSLTEFLKAQGVPFVKGAHSNINSKTNVVTLHLNHHAAAISTAIFGDVIIYAFHKTPDEIIKKYCFDVKEGCRF